MLDIVVIEGEERQHEPIAKTFMMSLTKHIEWMGLSDWTFKISYLPVDEKFGMETECQPEYYKAFIIVDLDTLDEDNRQRESMDEFVRHELMHVLLWIYTGLAEDLSIKRGKSAIRKMEERIVSDLERMPLWDILYEIETSDNETPDYEITTDVNEPKETVEDARKNRPYHGYGQ